MLTWTRLDRGPVERLLVLGTGRRAVQAARSLLGEEGVEFRLLGFVFSDAPTGLPREVPTFRVQETEEVVELARGIGATQVLVAWPELAREEVIRLSDGLRQHGIRLRVVSNIFDRLVESIPLDHVAGLPIMEVGATPLRGWRAAAKRAFDLTAAILGGLLILPLLLGIALAIKLTSPGPVLYRQTRLGKGGKPFTFYKFRSMLPGENGRPHRAYVRELVRENRPAGWSADGRPLYKYVDASRLTPIGRWLRRTSLDELPQLINVIRGEMSLVGPRPCLPYEYQLYKDWQKRRLDVTPGMTGLWQVTGRSLVTFEDMVLMDLFYIANWSFLLDIRLLLRTIPVVLWGKGGL
jgi:exopolysaccharide biosynthesis polyprenyl glycosylphosphotransferase